MTSFTIYYSYFYQPLPSHQFTALQLALPPEMQQQATRYKKWESAHAYVLGKHLLLQALQAASGTFTLHNISYNKYQKPTIQGFYPFNISHSGNLVICAVGQQGPVGVDIEQCKDLDINDFKNQFTIQEWQQIQQAATPLHTFYEYWTKKEAVLKADGRGLTDHLSQLSVIHPKVSFDNNNWHLAPIHFFPGYIGHIANSFECTHVEFIKMELQ
ncbi:4'-phosphopantetheinyl transferase family protein [Filimonas lacunae]|nr:4'-phosphopantetheinyl transferase superfamily protein [Filimonas lacunae]